MACTQNNLCRRSFFSALGGGLHIVPLVPLLHEAFVVVGHVEIEAPLGPPSLCKVNNIKLSYSVSPDLHLLFPKDFLKPLAVGHGGLRAEALRLQELAPRLEVHLLELRLLREVDADRPGDDAPLVVVLKAPFQNQLHAIS